MGASIVALVVKNLPANARDIRDKVSIPSLGRSPRRGQSNPVQCSCLENPMDCSMPGFSVYHHLLEPAQTHVHWVSDTIESSHPVVPFSSNLQSFPASGSFPVSQLFASGGQSIGASTSASVLPMNIRGLFPLGLTGLISLLSKGLSRDIIYMP